VELKKYLADMYGANSNERRLPQKPLPLYLKNGYGFSVFEIYGIEVLFAEPLDKSTPAAYRKQADILTGVFGLPCIIVLREIEANAKRWLMQNSVAFTVPGVLFFAPSIGMDISNKSAKRKTGKTDKFTPQTQEVYLYFLYEQAADGFVSQEQIAEALDMNVMAVSRAVAMLTEQKLLITDGDGWRKKYKRELSAREYIGQGLEHIISPVAKAFYTDEDKFNQAVAQKEVAVSGISALSKRTMLAADGYKTYTINKETARKIPESDRYETYVPGNIKVEIWKYNPHRFMEADGGVDGISLYAALREEKDERVQDALNNILEEYE
jgi:hypothetical protein